MWYSIALFVHILGAIGLFSAVSLVLVAWMRIRWASTPEQIWEWAGVAQRAGRSIPLIGLVILAPALYMVITAWGFTTPWVLASIIAFVMIAVLGATVNGRMLARLTAQKTASDSIPTELRALLRTPFLWLAEGARVMLLVGIVFLMTMKPGLFSSVAVLVGMLLLGILLGVRLSLIGRRTQQHLVRQGQRAATSR